MCWCSKNGKVKCWRALSRWRRCILLVVAFYCSHLNCSMGSSIVIEMWCHPWNLNLKTYFIANWIAVSAFAFYEMQSFGLSFSVPCFQNLFGLFVQLRLVAENFCSFASLWKLTAFSPICMVQVRRRRDFMKTK